MTTPLPQTTSARGTHSRRFFMGVSSLAAALVLAASAPVPVLGSDAAAACTASNGSCGG